MILFLLIFLTIYSSIHLYAFQKLHAAFALPLKIRIVILLIMLCMVLAPFLIHLQTKAGFESTARFTAYISYTWMGFLFLFLSFFFLSDIYNLILRGSSYLISPRCSQWYFQGKISFLSLSLVVFLLGSYSLIAARRIKVEKIIFYTPKLTVERLTIAHISDLHLGLMLRGRFLQTIVSLLKEAEPDLLVSTGDLVDAQINHLNNLIELFQTIKPKYGKFAVTGNHEYYAGITEALLFTKRSGFKVLQGEGVTIDNLFNLIGFDDETKDRFGQQNPQKEKELLSSFPGSFFTLLLKHRPNINNETLGLFDLQLSGHTHGGQIFPFTLLVKLFHPFCNGLYQLPKGSFLYTSTGTGTWGPPMRFLIPPKITFIEIIRGPKPIKIEG